MGQSVEDFLVELTRVRKRRGITLIKDFEELSKTDKEGAVIARDLLLQPDASMCRPVLMGCVWPSFFPDSAQAPVVNLDVR